MGIVYSGEHAFSWVLHYSSPAFATRMFPPLQRDRLDFSPRGLLTKTFLSKPSAPRSKPAFVNHAHTGAC
jgi:zona occludens toxin (predicted ATPase)